MTDSKIFDEINKLIVELDDGIDGLQQCVEILESELNGAYDYQHILNCITEREKCVTQIEDYRMFKKRLTEIIYV